MSGCGPTLLTNLKSSRVVPRAKLVYPAYFLYFATCFETVHRLLHFKLNFRLKLPFRKTFL